MARLKSNDTNLEGGAAAPVYRLDGDDAGAQAATPYLLEDSIGTGTWQDKPIFSQEQVIGQLDGGSVIEGKTITFSFFDGPHSIGLYNKPANNFSEPAGYSPMSEVEKATARQSMVLWDDLIAVNIVEKNGNGADIVLANTTTGPGQAWAYYPDETNGHKFRGDIWTADPTVNATNNDLFYGGYGRTTLVHEIGHSLGLSHPGSYNAGSDNDGDGQPDRITYQNSAVYAQDSLQFTIMSYFEDSETGADTFDVSLIHPSTPQGPLLHDILAIQEKYGADPTTRADDTVYFANSTAGNAVYDLATNPFPYLAVYDAGGNDTFDFSTANAGVFVDLRPGSFSSASAGYLSLDEANAAREASNAQRPDGAVVRTPLPAEVYEGWVGYITSQGEARVEADTGVSGVNTPSQRNLSIAYNTVIENATGGSARDYLVGNDVANMLKGNSGDYVLNGLGGDDTLWGGDGADEFRFFDHSGSDTIADFASGTDTIDLTEIDADTGTEGDQAFSFVGNAAFSGTAGELRSYSSGGASFFAGDVNGDGVADFTIGLGGLPFVQGDIVF